MKLHSLQDLFVAELRDIYDAEKQLIKGLGKMARAATAPELQSVFEEHLAETKMQVQRLEAVFDRLALRARGHDCEAMEGLIEEAKDLIDTKGEDSVRDAGLICAAQKVEHYEIAAYGCLVNWANQLGFADVVPVLEETLAEEKAADLKLTELAEELVNAEAEQPSV